MGREGDSARSPPRERGAAKRGEYRLRTAHRIRFRMYQGSIPHLQASTTYTVCAEKSVEVLELGLRVSKFIVQSRR